MRTAFACMLIGVASLALGACGGGDKAGGSGKETTLRIGVEDTSDRPNAKAADEFARQVRAVSDGKIRVRVQYRAARTKDDWDQVVARRVASGSLDGALVASRAWDTEGVKTLRPLVAPFLLTSEDAVERVVTGYLARELLAGLDVAGVVGLALIPEALRHPFAYGEPLVRPEDYRGTRIRAPRSDTTYALFRALGAKPDDPVQAAGDRTDAAETSYRLAPDLGRGTTATGNVTFYPKVSAVVVDADAWEDLGDEQRSQLREAAERTRDWAIANNVPDAEAARTYCENGGRIVTARPADVEALVDAAEPVYAELERDEKTAALISRIRATVRDMRVSATSAPATCDSKRRGSPAPAEVEAKSGVIPEGVYRTAVSKEELIDGGLPGGQAADYSGVHTLTLRDGNFVDDLKGENGAPLCHGTYESTARTLELVFDDFDCHGGLVAKWTLRDEVLHLTSIRSETRDEQELTGPVFGTNPWRKIG